MSQEIKSKETIFFEDSNKKLPDGIYPGMANDKVYNAMEVYAEQESIAFAEWLTTKDSPYSPIYGETERWCDSEREYTTAQLYEQFKQHPK